MWSRPPATAAGVAFERPATASEGSFVPQLWMRAEHPDPRDRVPRHPRREGGDDTVNSGSAPDWMNATNRFPPAENMEWDFITKDRKAHLRRAVQDDTENSYDAPAWFHQELKTAQQPEVMARFDTYRLGADKRVMLKNLVEVDPWGLIAPTQLPPARPRAGHFPSAERRMRGTLAPGELPARLGATEAAKLGAGDFDGELKAARAAPRERLGITSAALIGRGTVERHGGAAAGASGERLDGVLHTTAARFRDEPPSSDYFAARSRVLAPGSCIVRPISRAGVPTSSAAFGHGAKVGHALFHAMVLEHGSRPQQHVGESVARLRAMGTMDATRALLKSAPAGGFDTRRRELPLFGTNELRQPPLNWYSAAR
jgi:hypothetical protein